MKQTEIKNGFRIVTERGENRILYYPCGAACNVLEIQFAADSTLRLVGGIYNTISVQGGEKSQLRLVEVAANGLGINRGNVAVADSVVSYLGTDKSRIALINTPVKAGAFFDSRVRLWQSAVLSMSVLNARIDCIRAHVGDISDMGGSIVAGSCVGSPPAKGSFTMWKKAYLPNSNKRCIVELVVPKNAKRAGANRVRVSTAHVRSIVDMEGNSHNMAVSSHNPKFTYVVGKTVRSKFADNCSTCASGIHGFISRQMALAYDL